CYMLALIGFAGANIFYDAFLVDVTSEDRMDRISTRGFALGYIGSTIPFIGCIALIILSQKGTIPLSVGIASQISFAITALWWGLFTIPMLKNVEQTHYIERHPRPIRMSFKR
ncbi:MFS transporter, partial [Acinetobacter baumannii]|nr:MFS transporter [Acinetobacter baumannii]